VENILFLNGNFPYAKLKINELVSAERKFINKPVLIDIYEHPDFQILQDSYHYRQMLGAHRK
jgi:hypothetical protein